MPETQPEGTEKEAAKASKRSDSKWKTGAAGAGSAPSGGGGGGGKALTDWDLGALQAEVARRVAETGADDEEEDDMDASAHQSNATTT